MSGSHYQISFTQILESERRLQLSNILKVFAIKCKVTSDEKPVSLKEYISIRIKRTINTIIILD